ncbi:MAG: acyl-ACP--UDP-N-acetylglucosamine O-acyltransferase, partial [Planctomycetes bacterium]|nr:acyl-ACP--UDP-N-acetylglucosamine O-acyltransferase [Planctomycetota bacterium]
MFIDASARIHPSAVIDPQAELAEGVEVGPHVVIEGPVRIGANCRLRARATLIGPLTMGSGNDVGLGVVLGERPQHLSLTGREDTRTEIGDNNTFREHVTVHRGSPATGVTKIGDSNYLMANCHVGHDCRIANHTIIVNNSLLAGHCEISDRAFVSGNSSLHQFARVGRLAFLSGNSSSTKDILPFMILFGRDCIGGVNRVGMKRAGMTVSDIMVVSKAYQILFRRKLIQKLAIMKLDEELGHHPLIAEILQFIRTS